MDCVSRTVKLPVFTFSNGKETNNDQAHIQNDPGGGGCGGGLCGAGARGERLRLGQRVAKTVEGVTTLFVYDQEGRLILETEAGAEVAGREYLHRGDNRLAMYDMAGDAWYFFQNDPIGTPVAVTDEDNRIVWEAVYLPCGEAAVNPASLIEFNLRFAGQYFDAETGLHYNYHRYYDPKTGRYLTPDPIGLEGGINLYAYVQNNPISFIDPLGLEFIFDKSDKKLYWVEGPFESDAPAVLSWDAVSGPYGNGPLPNGWYQMTGEETPADSERNSMTDACESQNAYKFRLHPQFETNRDGLLIHPDGGVPGTAGCIGATGCTKYLRNFINTYLDPPTGKGNPNVNRTLPVYVRD